MNKTKYLRITFLLMLFICLLSINAFADRGVFNAKVTPDETFINTPTIITVTAEVGAENLYISSVAAYEVDAMGKPKSYLCRMYDDGTHGDETEADTVFTCQFNVNKPAKINIYVRITAAYSGDRNRYLSPVMSVKIFEPLPNNAPAQHATTLNSTKQNFTNYLSTMDVESAKQKALQDVLNDSAVSDAKLIGNTISVKFKDGTWGIIILDDPTVPSEGSGSALPPNTLPDDAQYPGNEQ